MLSLGGGMPNPSLFPFTSLAFATSDGMQLALTPAELHDALQYTNTTGLPALMDCLVDLQRREHSPPYKEWSIAVTNGSQDALTRAIEMLLQPGDSILVENPTYSGTLSFIVPYGLRMVSVPTDADGLDPAALDRMLTAWPADAAASSGSSTGSKPRVLYVVPTGQNPSGATLSAARRAHLYRVACRHNLMVLEDDPYFYLHYGKEAAPTSAAAAAAFRRPRLQSLFSIDTEQRVLRFDSFSKVLSSGLRIGFATGPNALMRQMELHMQATVLHTSGVSQAMVAKLLRAWGPAGLETHLCRIAVFYARKRDRIHAAAERHLAGLARWSVPDAGMFLWLELLHVADSRALVMQKGVAAKVLFVPGQAFVPTTTGASVPSRFVRASFSTIADDQMDEAMRRLAELLRAEQTQHKLGGGSGGVAKL